MANSALVHLFLFIFHMLLSEISPWLLITIGFVCGGAVLLCLAYLYQRLQKRLVPFQKGKRYWCKVIAVSDGDTITCQRFNLRRSQSRMRFAYIDAPESKQAFGAESKAIVADLMLKKWVRIEITDTDRYGRHVGVVYRRNQNLNKELIKRGAAWVYEDYIRDKALLQEMLNLQRTAKSKKRGLWKAARPVQPSLYRKMN